MLHCMTQHEYIFIAISIILGLAMARLLHSAALLVRAHSRVTYHWATALWGTLYLHLYSATVVGRLGAASGHGLVHHRFLRTGDRLDIRLRRR